jgi:GT2 family glycosyltransferase
MTPRVTIVSTVYDRVACLARCLRSVEHLAYADLEQIVVSDAPPAPVVAAIAGLVTAAPRVTRYINLPARTNNWGIAPAWAGLQAATGEYVCFLSDDNAYLPDHFGALVAALDADPDLGFVYSSCLYAGRRELRYTPPIGAGIDLGQPLFRRSVLPADPPAVQHAWDWALIASLMDRGVRWQHVDAATFVFKLEAYPQLVEALA